MSFFPDFIGNVKAVDFLSQALLSGQVGHAYLFIGPPNIGKETLAREFVKALLCQNQDLKKPCNSCSFCQQVEKEIHPDVIWVRKEEIKKNIAIEQIRDVINQLKRTSFLNSYKAAVVLEADNLSIGAANALLKTLEEPTAKTLLILTAHSLATLPKTIISRTQIIKLAAVPRGEIKTWLNKSFSADLAAEQASALAQGRPGLARRLLDNPQAMADLKDKSRDFLSLIAGSIDERFAYTDRLFLKKKEGDSARQEIIFLLNLWQVVVRDLALIKYGIYDKIVYIGEERNVSQMAAQISPEKIVAWNNILNFTKKIISGNGNHKLALDNLLLNL